ncbi:hypothetical protein FHW69_000771 [Luteibacter sp. Sphag1AF]|uniref:hypothetical protein n=1 Tax=Luteibacter sp. Sphag1AF TaxID=2587031 RepID=UPI00160EA64F|nr:hypothetical protein [Luteibacter sp. Sphag1AF]MBB3226181.1 hypothetical protein [Luteibacter sp. Sphag1AF]
MASARAVEAVFAGAIISQPMADDRTALDSARRTRTHARNASFKPWKCTLPTTDA